MIKSMREAKVHTTWAAPDDAYENAVMDFIRYALDVSRTNPFLESFAAFQARVARLGISNSLTQAVLKLTVPGVPDIYQGSELWDFSLVDPDNRRPVDFALRQRLAEAVCGATPSELARNWQDGREKLFVAARLLGLRRERPELFASGDYQPLDIGEGINADRLCAFARRHAGLALVVAVP